MKTTVFIILALLLFAGCKKESPQWNDYQAKITVINNTGETLEVVFCFCPTNQFYFCDRDTTTYVVNYGNNYDMPVKVQADYVKGSERVYLKDTTVLFNQSIKLTY